MDAAKWQLVKELFASLTDLDASERAAFLHRVGAQDEELRAELESLLRAHLTGSGFIEQPAAQVFGVELGVPHPQWIGRRLGQYRIVAELGSGGMSEVYRAVRDDDEYAREVAIKILRVGLNSRTLLQRFTIEKQILASLDHPNIARLLDAGSTQEGLPFLIMDFIRGEPIDDYCTRHRLGVRGCLELFLTLCDAVQYVHQHLMVHGDLKCSNVLVTEEGVVKLLDFGVARLLTPLSATASSERPPTAVIALTPDYASPEQIRGNPVTTASDVYSLGVLLYRLLTGTLPHSKSEGSGADSAARIHELDPPLPSAARGSDVHQSAHLVRQLRGDIDNIVLLALQKDPTRRYASAAQFRADVWRHLHGFPVHARAATLAYRTGKFLTRNRAAVLVSCVVLMIVFGGIATIIWEARRAQLERDVAARRFNDVRALAHTLIFEVHDSIRYLQGGAQGRHVILTTALRYLDALSHDSAGDLGLQRELADAYERLGDLQGKIFAENESDYAGSIQSFRHAINLRERALGPGSQDEEEHRNIVRDYMEIGDIAWLMGDSDAALSYSLENVRRTERFADSSNLGLRMLPAATSADYGYKLFKIKGQAEQSLTYLNATSARLEPIWAALRSDARDRVGFALARAYVLAAEVLCYQKRYPEALVASERAREIYAALQSSQPGDEIVRRMNALRLHREALILLNLVRIADAEQQETEALSTLEALHAAAPTNGGVQVDIATSLWGLAVIQSARHETERPLGLLRRALDALAGAQNERASATYINTDGTVSSELGRLHFSLAEGQRPDSPARMQELREARNWYQTAQTSFGRVSTLSFEAAESVQRLAEQIGLCDRLLASADAH